MKKAVISAFLVVFMGSGGIAIGASINMSTNPAPAIVGENIQFQCSGGESSQDSLIAAKITIFNAQRIKLVNWANMSVSGNIGTYDYTIPSNEQAGNWSYKCVIKTDRYRARQTKSFAVESATEPSSTPVPVNHPPVAAEDSITAPYETPTAADVSANDRDDENNLDPATIAVTIPPANGATELVGDRNILYTPDAGFSGFDSFVYQICDTGSLCDSAVVSVNVESSANNPPTAEDDMVTTPYESGVAINVAINDTDTENNLELSTVDVTAPPANGSTELVGDGTVLYTPNGGFSGIDSFTYQICDTNSLCDSAVVRVNVELSMNIPPAAEDDMVATPYESVVAINVAVNDTDTENNLNIATVAVTSPPANGLTELVGDGTVLYTPVPGFSGIDSFVYQICDTSSLCDSATVVVTVGGPADDENPDSVGNLLDSKDLLGFGQNTTGGLGGEICPVNNLNDSGSGSLRSCADSAGSKWIRFNVSGNIRLNSPLYIRSNKTIDGRGQHVTISGYGLRMHGVDNIIVHNVALVDGVGALGDNTLNNDAVQIWKGSSNIWLDHLTLSNWPDELLDISHASTDITVSWNHFAYHPNGRNYGVLLGSSITHTQDVNMRITLHHNFFDRMTERGPHARFGKFHFFNNYTYDWKNRAGTSVMEAELLSEDNIFEAVRSRDAFHTETSPYAPQAGKLRSVNDWMINGAYHTDERLPQSVFNAGNYYSYSLAQSNSALRDSILSGAGWQNFPAY